MSMDMDMLGNGIIDLPPFLGVYLTYRSILRPLSILQQLALPQCKSYAAKAAEKQAQIIEGYSNWRNAAAYCCEPKDGPWKKKRR